jgi:hypothetical protein
MIHDNPCNLSKTIFNYWNEAPSSSRQPVSTGYVHEEQNDVAMSKASRALGSSMEMNVCYMINNYISIYISLCITRQDNAEFSVKDAEKLCAEFLSNQQERDEFYDKHIAVSLYYY